MIILQIKNIKQVKPIEWKAKDLSELKAGQRFVRFVGNHPNQPEHGSVILSTKLIGGQFDNIDKVLFIGSDAQEGRLVSHDKQLLGGHKVEIEFDTIYGHGLKYCVQDFIQKGGAIVGLTQSENETLNSFETQKALLSLLSDYIIPNRKKLILNFARPGFICIPNEESNSNKSHYLGCPKHKESEIKDSNGNQLYHLATLDLDEFQSSQEWANDNPNLSFYIRIEDTQNSWPEGKDDFRVLPIINKYSSKNLGNYEDAINFNIKPLLDLPGYDHSLIHHYKFSDEDRDRYDALRSSFTQLVLGEEIDEAVNKLLGYPDSVQNCVAYEAERIFNKREYSDEIYKDAKDWCLLLQISPYCKWFKFFDDFGDGSIYFMIRKGDLESGEFKNCQVVVQNS